MKRHGGRLVAVDPRYTSQTCSCCGRHPKDSPETAHLPHGRVSRDRFVCPLCSFACDADLNAARNILARGKLATNDNIDDLVVTAGGSLRSPRHWPGHEAGTKETSAKRPSKSRVTDGSPAVLGGEDHELIEQLARIVPRFHASSGFRRG